MKRLYEALLQKYPDQAYFDADFVSHCFTRIMLENKQTPLRVLELGGYDGTLALEMFKKFPNISW